jgi:hypothetical protein
MLMTGGGVEWVGKRALTGLTWTRLTVPVTSWRIARMMRSIVGLALACIGLSLAPVTGMLWHAVIG